MVDCREPLSGSPIVAHGEKRHVAQRRARQHASSAPLKPRQVEAVEAIDGQDVRARPPA